MSLANAALVIEYASASMSQRSLTRIPGFEIVMAKLSDKLNVRLEVRHPDALLLMPMAIAQKR